MDDVRACMGHRQDLRDGYRSIVAAWGRLAPPVQEIVCVICATIAVYICRSISAASSISHDLHNLPRHTEQRRMTRLDPNHAIKLPDLRKHLLVRGIKGLVQLTQNVCLADDDIRGNKRRKCAQTSAAMRSK